MGYYQVLVLAFLIGIGAGALAGKRAHQKRKRKRQLKRALDNIRYFSDDEWQALKDSLHKDREERRKLRKIFRGKSY